MTKWILNKGASANNRASKDRFLSEHLSTKIGKPTLHQLVNLYLNKDKVPQGKLKQALSCIQKIESLTTKISNLDLNSIDPELNDLKMRAETISSKLNSSFKLPKKMETKSLFLDICIKLFEEIPKNQLPGINLTNYLSKEILQLFTEVGDDKNKFQDIKNDVRRILENHQERFSMEDNPLDLELKEIISNLKSKQPLPTSKK